MPAALIVTEGFVAAANASATVYGLPGYAFAVVPHAVGRSPSERVREIAHAAVDRVVDLLVEDPGSDRPTSGRSSPVDVRAKTPLGR